MADDEMPTLRETSDTEEEEDSDDDCGPPPLVPESSGSDDGTDLNKDDSDTDSIPDLKAEADGDSGEVEAVPLCRPPAPYSAPVGGREEGPAALLRKQAAAAASHATSQQTHTIVQPATSTQQVQQQQASSSKAATGASGAAVQHEAFAKFKERELEDKKRLRKERGFADAAGLSQLVVARCHLRPGAPCTKLCEHDSVSFLIKSADRRILVECDKGCRMLYHYPNCWRRVTKAYKDDVDPNWNMWSKGKDMQLVPCITNQCEGFIVNAFVCEGPPGEETSKEQQYTMPKELREQLVQKRLDHIKEQNEIKLAAIDKEHEEAAQRKRRRKAEKSAARKEAKAKLAAVAIGSKQQEQQEQQSGNGWKQVVAKGKVAPVAQPAAKQPAIKIYNTGKTTKVVESVWATGGSGGAAADTAGRSAGQLDDADFPSLGSANDSEADANGASTKGKKKKTKMIPLDPRSMGFHIGDAQEYNNNDQYTDDDYYYSGNAVSDTDYCEFDSKYPRFERNANGKPLYPDELYQALEHLKLDYHKGTYTNHLLVECLDIARLVEDTGHTVDPFLRDMFSQWGGTVSHFRIFTRQEAAAVSMSRVDDAILAFMRTQGMKQHRTHLVISFLKDFPNDVSLSRVFASYTPNKSLPKVPKQIPCYVRYVPFADIEDMTVSDFSDADVLRRLSKYPYVSTIDGSAKGIPPPPRNLVPRFEALPPPAAASVVAAAPAPAEAPAAAAAKPAAAAAAAVPAALAISPASELEQRLESAQIIGCTTQHLQDRYRKFKAFQLGRPFFRDPHTIAPGRTALLLCNVETRELEGLWEATGNVLDRDGSPAFEFKPLEAMPALPFEVFAPLLPADALQSAAAGPIKLPSRLDANHTRLVLQAYSRAAIAAAAANPRTPTPTPTAPSASPPPAAPAPAAPASPAVPQSAAITQLAANTAAAAAAAPPAVRPPALQVAAAAEGAPPSTSTSPVTLAPTNPAPFPLHHLRPPSATPTAAAPAPQPFTYLTPTTLNPQKPAPPLPTHRPMYTPLTTIQPSTKPPAPPRDVNSIFPFFLAQQNAARPAAPTALPPLPIAQNLAAPRPSVPPLPAFAAHPPLPNTTSPPTQAPAPASAPLPFLTSVVPAASPSPVPPPVASPTPPAASPTPAAKPKHPCPVCGIRKFRHLHVSCKGYGPCDDCLPDLSMRESLYPICVKCNQPTTNLVKVHW